jgi:hypothetical protein
MKVHEKCTGALYVDIRGAWYIMYTSACFGGVHSIYICQ